MFGWWSTVEVSLNPWLLAAGVATAITFVIHFIVGGREIARPLLESRDMNDVARLTSYYCWHLVSLTLLAIAFGFVWASLASSRADVATGLMVLTLSFAVLSLGLVIATRQSAVQMPQWSLFLVITALAVIGQWSTFFGSN